MPSGQDYANRLREDAHRSLAPHVNELEQELNNLKNDLTLSCGHLTQKVEAIRYFSLPEADRVVTEALEEASRERDSRLSSVASFVRSIRYKETQEEILSLLLDEAGKVSPRIALFAVRGGRLRGWSSRGFSRETADRISGCSFELSEDTFLQRALESDVFTTAPGVPEEASLHFIQEEASGPWHVFPLKAIGRPVALLLAIAAEGRECHLESLCVLADLTGLCVENLALKILKEDRRRAEPVTEAATEQVTEPVAAEERPQEAVPVSEAPVSAPAEPQPVASGPGEEDKSALGAQSVQIVEQIPAAQPEPQPVATAQLAPEVPPEAEAETRREEPEATPTAREWVEEITEVTEPAIETAPAPEPAETREPRPAPVEAHALAEEERLHSEARRFARLLVSEIKLYNEQRVVDGRQNRDLYVRLKKDIDKSREMYEKRVPPSVARKIDYFHDEVVRILGENDPSTLGSDYPGPRVES